ncbi:6104_t:CDS:1, partial [Gigaspora rosea]
MIHTYNRCNKPFKKLWMLTRHLQNRKFQCRPQVIPTTNPIPIPQIEPEAVNSLDQVSNSSDLSIQSNRENTEASISSTSQNVIDKYISREEFEYLKTLGLIENDAVLDTGIHFIQIRVSNPKRPHDNLNLLSNWEAI